MIPIMKCGHAANASFDKKPCCAICAGLDPGAYIEAPMPDLTGRKASCTYGNHAIVDSNSNLPYFEHCPTRERDSYYCGCYGWD